MADRIVSVHLRADVDAYNRGILEAKATTEGLDRQVIVVTRDVKELTPETVKASKATEQLGVEAGKAKAQTKGLGDEIGKTKEHTTGLGEETRKTRERIVDLAADIVSTKDALADLGVEFRKTGQVNVTELDRLSRSLRDLERAKSTIGSLIPNGPKEKRDLLNFALDEWIVDSVKSSARAIRNAGSKAGELFGAGLQGTLSTPVLGPIIATGLVGAILVASPMITAALAAAVNLGFGGGVLALGISRAVADERVMAAWSGLGETVTRELDKSSARFVDPLISAANRFETAWTADVMPHVDSAMTALAPKLDTLVEGAIGFVRNVGPGFDAAVAAAGPFIDILAENLPDIGDAISEFLEHLNNAGPGAEMFFEDILVLTEDVISALGWLVEKGSAVYEIFAGLGEVLTGNFSAGLALAKDGFEHVISGGDRGQVSFGGFHNKTIDVDTALGLLNGTLQKTSDGEIKVSDEAGKVIETWNTLYSQAMAISNATLGFNESLLKFNDGVKTNGVTLDEHTQKGINNTRMLEGSISKIADWKKANDDGRMSTAALNEHLNAQFEEFRKAALGAGFSRSEVDKLIERWRSLLNVPPASPQVNVGQISNAISQGQTLSQILSNLDGKVSRASVITTYRTIIQEQRNPEVGQGLGRSMPLIPHAKGGIVQHAATGLITQPGVYRGAGDGFPVVMAEGVTGREGIVPERGISDQRFFGLVSEIASWRDMQVVPRQAPGAAAFATSRPVASGGGNTTYITIPVNAGIGTDGYRVGQQVAEVLRPFVERHGNSVQMAIVGRQVP